MSPGLPNCSYSAVPSMSEPAKGELHLLESSTAESIPLATRSNSSTTSTEMSATEKKAAGIRDSICAWDPDAVNLLKVVGSENLEALQELLHMGVHINGHGGSFHETALHRAAQIGWADGVSYLLSAGASVYVKNQFGQTPLHYAAKASKSTACIKLLLETNRPGVVDHRDMRGHTPLHDASATGCVNAINLLIKAGALVSAKDGNGETPLHKAAKARSVGGMVALLNAGADIAAVDSNGESVLTYVLHHIPGMLDAVFDHCLVTNSPKLNAKTLEVSMNFLPLTGPYESNQVQNLQSFVNNSHAKLLNHPLCEIFLQLKWLNVRRLFLIEVIFYLLFAVFTTLMVFNKFVWTTDSGNITTLIQEKGELWRNWGKVHLHSEKGIRPLPQKAEEVLQGIVLIQTSLILLQQLLSILQNKLAWFRSLAGVLHVIITLLVLAVVLGSVPQEWQHHLASLLLLLMWTECMLLIGRFPNCGIYVVMFTRVAKVFLRIFAIYFCLLLSFSSAFYVIFHSNTAEEGEVFSDPILTFIKTITMMIGEVDFGVELNNGLSHLFVTGHVIFMLFVILVSIILSNLLVALAVNDVQGLRSSAHLERLIKQTELVFQMEKNFGTASYLASHVRIPKLQSLLMRVAYICKHDCNNSRVFMMPSNPKKANKLFVVQDKKCRESTLSSHLLGHVMDCLKTRETSNDSKGSSRMKRGSRIRRGDYGRADFEDVQANLRELEANVLDFVNDKLEVMVDSYGSLSQKITTLEDKLQRVSELLMRVSENLVPSGSGNQDGPQQEGLSKVTSSKKKL
ncbi:hypothetical protein SK128_010399 [Halocaridina rubra]|uniref:Ion transport domain-containing protein n=1 Tax=Halocaridina rubra TaxID=373956 RepID=A0AAN8XD04_HALRR